MGGGGSAQVGGGRGPPRRVRRVEQAQVREDLAHHGRVRHRGDEPQPAATARAGEDIEIEHAAHQGGPRPRARGAGGAGAGLAFARMDVRGRAAVADAVRAPASMRGENAVIQNQVDRGARDDGRELLHELDRLEEQMRGAIAPDRLQRDADAPVGPELDAVLGERGTEEVAAELLEAGTIVGGDPDVGVEIEAVDLGLTRAAGGDVTEVRLVAEAPDAAAGAGAEGDAALDGGAGEAGQDGRGVGERVRRGRVVGGLELAAGEQASPLRRTTHSRQADLGVPVQPGRAGNELRPAALVEHRLLRTDLDVVVLPGRRECVRLHVPDGENGIERVAGMAGLLHAGDAPAKCSVRRMRVVGRRKPPQGKKPRAKRRRYVRAFVLPLRRVGYPVPTPAIEGRHFELLSYVLLGAFIQHAGAGFKSALALITSALPGDVPYLSLVRGAVKHERAQTIVRPARAMRLPEIATSHFAVRYIDLNSERPTTRLTAFTAEDGDAAVGAVALREVRPIAR
jgi:hypothetical protein